MSSTRLLEAFNQAGGGKVTATAARMRYEHGTQPNMQVLEFDGQADGKAFAVVSQPFVGNPVDKAREIAGRILVPAAPVDFVKGSG